MNNKQRANALCPMIDFGIPQGDVWVITKKAVLPYTITEMGSGPEGKAKVEGANWRIAHSRPQVSNRRRAVDAFTSGAGALTDLIKAEDIVTDPHYSAKDALRAAELHPEVPTPSLPKRVWQAFKAACKDVWDGAQKQD